MMDFLGITEMLAKCVIRPPRSNYSVLDLGPKHFDLKGSSYARVDFKLLNHNNYQLECSLYKDIYAQKLRPLVIMLHANSSSRLSAKNYLKQLLPYFDVLGFDFAGSGISEGEYATLGYHEKQDLKTVLDYMVEVYGAKQVFLWGRSMGAVTSILFLSKYKQQTKGLIKAAVLDSPFSNLVRLVSQLAYSYVPILPGFVVNTLLENIQEQIDEFFNKTPLNPKLKTSFQQFVSPHQKPRDRKPLWECNTPVKKEKKKLEKFDIFKVSPIQCISTIEIPLFFVAGKEDKLVSHQHAIALYEKVKSYKHLELVEGGHNDTRMEPLKQKIAAFFKIHLSHDQNPQSQNYIPKQNNSQIHTTQQPSFMINTLEPSAGSNQDYPKSILKRYRSPLAKNKLAQENKSTQNSLKALGKNTHSNRNSHQQLKKSITMPIQNTEDIKIGMEKMIRQFEKNTKFIDQKIKRLQQSVSPTPKERQKLLSSPQYQLPLKQSSSFLTKQESRLQDDFIKLYQSQITQNENLQDLSYLDKQKKQPFKTAHNKQDYKYEPIKSLNLKFVNQKSSFINNSSQNYENSLMGKRFSVQSPEEKTFREIIKETMSQSIQKQESQRRRKIFGCTDSNQATNWGNKYKEERKQPSADVRREGRDDYQTLEQPLRLKKTTRQQETETRERKMRVKNFYSESFLSELKNFKLETVEESESILIEKNEKQRQRRKIFGK